MAYPATALQLTILISNAAASRALVQSSFGVSKICAAGPSSTTLPLRITMTELHSVRAIPVISVIAHIVRFTTRGLQREFRRDLLIERGCALQRWPLAEARHVINELFAIRQ